MGANFTRAYHGIAFSLRAFGGSIIVVCCASGLVTGGLDVRDLFAQTTPPSAPQESPAAPQSGNPLFIGPLPEIRLKQIIGAPTTKAPVSRRTLESGVAGTPPSGNAPHPRGPRKSPTEEEIRLPFEPGSSRLAPNSVKPAEGSSPGDRSAQHPPEAPAAPEQVMEAKRPRMILVKEARPAKLELIDNPVEKSDEGARPEIESLTLERRSAPPPVRLASSRAPAVTPPPVEIKPPSKTLLGGDHPISPPEPDSNPRQVRSHESQAAIDPIPLKPANDTRLSAAATQRSPKMLPPLPTRVPDGVLPGKPAQETEVPDVAVNQSQPGKGPAHPTVDSATPAPEGDQPRIAMGEPRPPMVVAPRIEEAPQSPPDARPAELPADPSPGITPIPEEAQNPSLPAAVHDPPPPSALSQAPTEATPRSDETPRRKMTPPETGVASESPEQLPKPTHPGDAPADAEGGLAATPPQPSTPESAPRPDRTPEAESPTQLPGERPVTPEPIEPTPSEHTGSYSPPPAAPFSIPPSGEPSIPDLPPSTAESAVEAPAEIEPSPLDPATPITGAVRDYLSATAPVLEELSLLMTRIPGLALDDFDVVRGGVSVVPQDITVKMEAMKRDLQVLDSRTFSIVPPKDFARFHARIRESITETYRACESAVNFFTERNAEDLKKVHEHVERAGTLLAKSLARTN